MAWGDKNEPQGPWGTPPPSGGNPFGGPSGQQPPPPDFDEWLRRSQEKLGRIFGGGNETRGAALLIAIFALLWLSSGIYFVKADEQGVVLRFGEYHRTTGSGPNYHFPYPFESVMTPRVTAINRVEIGFRSSGNRGASNDSLSQESLMLTGDENIVDINFEVQWKISSAEAYLFNVRNPEETVKAVAESAMREVIGRNAIATVLTTGREAVGMETKNLIQKILDEYKCGIEIVRVNLGDVNPPSEVLAAFRDVQSARVDMETARNEAEAYRNDILPKARGEAQKQMLDAEAYKQEVIARAQGEASRFSAVYNEYKQAKDVTKKRMYLETMEEILASMNKVIVEGRGAQGVVPYLPLSELKPKQEAAP